MQGMQTYGKNAGARTYGEFVEESLAGRVPQKGPPGNVGPSGTAVAQLTYQDQAIRTQQVITKVVLNPSNVLGYDLIYMEDLNTGLSAFEGARSQA
jgi:hypothetical protein